MKIEIQITTDNDSFFEDFDSEISRILKSVSDTLSVQYEAGIFDCDIPHYLMDINGNVVGTMTLS